MVPELRRAYNAAFTPERYAAFLSWLEREGGCPVDFRVSETPIFLADDVALALQRGARELQAQLATPQYMAYSQDAIPAGRAVPGDPGTHPLFLQIDFALASDEAGNVVPRLIELQGFPSLYGFQWHLARGYQKHFEMPPDWHPYFSGYREDTYAARLRQVLVGDGDPAETVLLEVHPEQQKTRIDFAVTERVTGVATVDALAVVKRGRKLYYQRDGREIEIRRIYNRVIFDELDRKGIDLSHLFAEEIDAEWLGHPNWFFRISKYSLPYLRGEFVPDCRFLHEVRELGEVPDDLENYVLKPIYSFAGLGVEVDVTREKIAAVRDPRGWILQRKVAYAPVVATPDGPSKAEVRMMFFWQDEPVLVNSLVRMSKGKMLGVDFNKDKTWIGASVAFHDPAV